MYDQMHITFNDTGKQAPPRAWGRDKEPSTPKTDPQQQQAQQQQKWNNSPLPEWASDDSVTSTAVGTFDSSGNFTTSAEKVCRLENFNFYQPFPPPSLLIKQLRGIHMYLIF